MYRFKSLFFFGVGRAKKKKTWSKHVLGLSCWDSVYLVVVDQSSWLAEFKFEFEFEFAVKASADAERRMQKETALYDLRVLIGYWGWA